MSAKIWPWFGGEYRAHVSAKQRQELMRWTGVEHGSTYTYPDKPQRYDIQFPRKLLRPVRAYLGLGPKSARKTLAVSQGVTGV